MPTKPKSIITPVIDALCCGGLSIVVVCALFFIAEFLPALAFQTIDFRKVVIFHTLINWPHFFASYRLLYRSREQVSEHRWASVFIPLILLLLSLWGVFSPGSLRFAFNYQVVNFVNFLKK